MKKIFIVMISVLFLLSGCAKKEEKITYDYAFTDFLDIQLAGADGYGKVYIEEKDFDSTAFEDEADYIAVKKLLPEILENTVCSKSEGISNGDVVTIAMNDTFAYTGNLSIDFSPRSFEVTTLSEPKKIDLFDSSNVLIYGLSGTKQLYTMFPSSSVIPEEIREHLKYTLSTDDETVEKNKTIVHAEVSVDSDFLKENKKYSTLEDYFTLNGYVTELSDDIILKKVVYSSDLSAASRTDVRETLETYISENNSEITGYEFKGITSVQEIKDFDYDVIAEYQNGEDTVYVIYDTEMAYIGDKLAIYDMSRGSKCEADAVMGKEIFSYNTETVLEINTGNVKESEKTEETEEAEETDETSEEVNAENGTAEN